MAWDELVFGKRLTGIKRMRLLITPMAPLVRSCICLRRLASLRHEGRLNANVKIFTQTDPYQTDGEMERLHPPSLSLSLPPADPMPC